MTMFSREAMRKRIVESMGRSHSSVEALCEDILDSVGPLIAANERIGFGPLWRGGVAEVERDLRADLSAKVEALYTRCTDDPTRGEELTDWVRRDAVLDILRGNA